MIVIFSAFRFYSKKKRVLKSDFYVRSLCIILASICTLGVNLLQECLILNHNISILLYLHFLELYTNVRNFFVVSVPVLRGNVSKTDFPLLSVTQKKISVSVSREGRFLLFEDIIRVLKENWQIFY